MSNSTKTHRKTIISLPTGWFVVGIIVGGVIVGLICGILYLMDVPTAVFPPPTPTATLTPTSTPTPTATTTPTITPTPAPLDFSWSIIRWSVHPDNRTIAVGTIRLLIDGGFPPYQVLLNNREIEPIAGIFYITIQTPNCEAVSGNIEVRSRDGQRMVRTYALEATDIPCPTPTTAP